MQSAASSAIRRVGILFSGGPAPAANAVICSAAMSFLDAGLEVIGFYDGYEHLQKFDAQQFTLEEGEHYHRFTLKETPGLRTVQGIFIRTARANPGKAIKKPVDLANPEKNKPLQRVYEALCSLEIDALISIGGDDTLKTANFMVEYQKRLSPEARRVKVVHLPKTIDNDYHGIDFTFGYFTAVDFLSEEVKNLRADAKATRSYFIAEVMGRKAGWLSYGVGIAGKANLIVSVEDLDASLTLEESFTDEATGKTKVEKKLNVDALAGRIVDLILHREKSGKKFGVVVLAEGLGELLPARFITHVSRDDHGHISLGKLDFGKLMASVVANEYEKRTGKAKKVNGIQLGYEARCARPHAFDVMLGCQLGHGAYRALVERGLDGHMVSTAGQMSLTYVPFQELVDPETLVTKVRFIEQDSDFFRLARFLEEKVPRG
ncbi:MAG: 6-phosphofructokinase [Myxococcota bacterium]